MTHHLSSPFQGLSPAQLGDQSCYIYYDAHSAPLLYTLSHLDNLAQSRMITGIHSGVRIGAGVVLGVLLLLLARTYRSMMFCLYEINFILMTISSILQLAWILSFNASITEFITDGDIPLSNLQLSIASSAFQMFLIMSLLATLVMQIYVACSDLRQRLQYSVTALSALACFPTYFIWFWRFVLVCIQDLGPKHGQSSYGYVEDQWVYKGAWPSFAASTSVCSLVLCIKLWMVHDRRAKIGVEKFDPIRVLLTMAAQNSVLPAILAIVAAAINSENFGGQSVSAACIPLTAVLLPTGYILAQYNMLRGASESQRPPVKSIRIDSCKKSEFSEPYTAETPLSDVASYTNSF